MAETVTIHESKTEAGERVIPLNEDALSTVRELYCRASQTGGTGPDHYVFPACENDDLTLRFLRRAGAQRGGVSEKLPKFLRCAFTTSGIMQLRNWLSPRRVMQPSWQSPVTSPGRCWSTIRTFGSKQNGRLWRRFQVGEALQYGDWSRNKPRHNA